MDTITSPKVVTISEEIDATAVECFLRELSRVPDHRRRRGIRYRLNEMLACVAFAKFSGATSVADIHRWISNHAKALAAFDLPLFSYKTTLRLVRWTSADRLDDALNAAVREAVCVKAAKAGTMVVSIDGKELTGSVRREGSAIRLVSVYDHATRVVIAQVPVASKGGEQGALPGLVGQVTAQLREHTGWSGSLVVTLDANFCGSPSLAGVRDAQAEWMVTAKGNWPTVYRRLGALDWGRPQFTRHDKTHGRDTNINVCMVEFDSPADSPIPGAKSALRINRVCERPNTSNSKSKKHKNRKRKPRSPSLRTTRRGGTYTKTEETTYVVCSYSVSGDNPAETLYTHNREHWGIEANHYVRDVDFKEDASQLRAGTAPRFMAAFNNFTISLIRLTEGANANIRAATQKAAASIAYTISLLTPLLE